MKTTETFRDIDLRINRGFDTQIKNINGIADKYRICDPEYYQALLNEFKIKLKKTLCPIKIIASIETALNKTVNSEFSIFLQNGKEIQNNAFSEYQQSLKGNKEYITYFEDEINIKERGMFFPIIYAFRKSFKNIV